MSPKILDSRHAIESCTIHLHSWKPFDSSDSGLHTKRQCRADRKSTSLPIESAALDMSKLTLGSTVHKASHVHAGSGEGLHPKLTLGSTVHKASHVHAGSGEGLHPKLTLFDDNNDRSLCNHNKHRLIAGKRRRRGSRSVSGRSSDRSGTRRRCCSVGASAAYGTCSDFPVGVGTDSSGEFFVNNNGNSNSNGDNMNWVFDVSSSSSIEVVKTSRKDKECGERDSSNGLFVVGNFNETSLGNESGYGSEPGYRGDAEFGYGDELDEEEDDQWGDDFGALSKMEKVGENTLQKVHHRCRRRKQDCKMVIP